MTVWSMSVSPFSVPPAGAALWTPAQLGASLIGWWDMTASTITHTTTISGISDLSGNGNDLTQGNGALQPGYNATGINGLPAADWTANGSPADQNISTAGSLVVAQPLTVLTLFRQSGSLPLFGNLYDGSSAAGNRIIYFNNIAGDGNVFELYGGTLVNTGVSLTTSTNYLSVESWNGASTAYGLNGANPTTLGSNPGTAGIISGFSWGSINGTGNANPLLLIGFGAVINRALTTTERQKFEGYAAWQFGLNNSVLPPAHPYYNTRPTV